MTLATTPPVVALDRFLERCDEARRHAEDTAAQLASLAMDVDRLTDGLRNAGRELEADVRTSAAPGELIGPSVTPEPPPRSWRCCPIETCGTQFEVLIDLAAEDPVAEFCARGEVEAQVLPLILSMVQPGDLVIDLGSHIGTVTLAAASVGCRVLAVEADPDNAALLRASAAHNGFGQVLVVNAAASDEAGELRFSPHGPTGFVVSVVDLGYPTIRLPAVTVDELIDLVGWGPPVVVKIDVEGSEIRAIQGMRRALSAPRAPILLYESNGFTQLLQGSRPAELVTAVERLGYRCHLIEGAELVRFRPDDLQVSTVADHLAVRDPAQLPAGWPVVDGTRSGELRQRVIAECGHPVREHRMYMASALETADPSLLDDPGIAEALDRILVDPEPRAREAAAWWDRRR